MPMTSADNRAAEIIRRMVIAEEIIRKIDAVQLATCAQVADIHRRAQAGEFDHKATAQNPPSNEGEK
jgi:hypothetical protein